MHGIFIWAASIKFYSDPGLIISLTEYPGNMHISKFYFHHMLLDIYDISSACGKDFEQSALIVHMVIDRIMSCQENIGK